MGIPEAADGRAVNESTFETRKTSPQNEKQTTNVDMHADVAPVSTSEVLRNTPAVDGGFAAEMLTSTPEDSTFPSLLVTAVGTEETPGLDDERLSTTEEPSTDAAADFETTSSYVPLDFPEDQDTDDIPVALITNDQGSSWMSWFNCSKASNDQSWAPKIPRFRPVETWDCYTSVSCGRNNAIIDNNGCYIGKT